MEVEAEHGSSGSEDRGQVVQACDWDSRTVALRSDAEGRRAASFTSSRRLGIEPPSFPIAE